MKPLHIEDIDPTQNLVLYSNQTVHFSLFRNPPQGAEEMLEAADELVSFLQLATGCEVPQFDDSYAVRFILDLDCRSDLCHEEFLIEISSTYLRIAASALAGLFHGVYWFLERYVGIRWLWPGADGEVVPTVDELTVPCGLVREKPDFAWRAMKSGGAVDEALDVNTSLHVKKHLPLQYFRDFNIWCRRNRFGGLNIADGHRWSEIAPPKELGAKHPEYYAENEGKRDNVYFDGKHRNQPCLSNNAVIDLLSDYAIGKFDADPTLDVVSISPNDGGASCECEGCRAIDAAAGAEHVLAAEDFDHLTGEVSESGEAFADGQASTGRDAPTGGETPANGEPLAITDRLFAAANRVASSVSEKHPDKRLLIHLYDSYRTPPVTTDLHPSVIGQYCVMGNSFHDEKIRCNELERISGFSKMVSELGIYEYYANGAWPEIHRLFPDLVAESVRSYYECGARYFSTQVAHGFGCNGFNSYLLARALWNVDVDWREVVYDYCRAGFGPAAKVIRAYLLSFTERWKSCNSGLDIPKLKTGEVDYSILYNEAFLEERRKELEQAQILASGVQDDGVSARIQFLADGLDYTAKLCSLVRATKAASSGVNTESDDIDSVLAARRWLADSIHSCRGRYVVSDFWVDYREHRMGADERLKDENDYPRSVNQTGLPAFETSGSHYACGLAVGSRFRDLICEGYRCHVNDNLTDSEREILEESLNFMKARFPHLISEMEGIAEATGLSLWQVYNYNSFNAIERVRIAESRACSIVAVADCDGSVVLGGNLDLDNDNVERRHYFVHKTARPGVEVTMLQWAGNLWAHGGMNSHGLACTSASTTALPATTYSAMPQHIALHHLLLTCVDVDSAISELTKIPFLGKGQNFGFADAKGTVAMVEKSASYQGTSTATGVSMYRTNHYLTAEMAKYNEGREIGSSGRRYRHLQRTLGAGRFPNAYEVCKKLLSDHGVDRLCGHGPWAFTAASLICCPSNGTAEFSGGQPCSVPYTKYS